jgi:hypothetical protein
VASSKGLNLGLELKVTEVEEDVGDDEEQVVKGEKEDLANDEV